MIHIKRIGKSLCFGDPAQRVSVKLRWCLVASVIDALWEESKLGRKLVTYANLGRTNKEVCRDADESRL